MYISDATVDDSRAVAEIHVAAWKSAYADIVPAAYLAGLTVESREAIWRKELSRNLQKVALVKADEQVLGWIRWGASRDADVDSNTAEIWAINVSPTVGLAVWGVS